MYAPRAHLRKGALRPHCYYHYFKTVKLHPSPHSAEYWGGGGGGVMLGKRTASVGCSLIKCKQVLRCACC